MSISTSTPGRSPFHRNFYVANSMEIFERLAWYGFFTLSSLYMTSPRSQGGLGLNDQERGFLQGMIPFLLYLLPVITGALADRYGYRRMFLIAFTIMCPSYFLLGQVHGFWSFCAVFLAVAIGAACFKPVVVGTIGRTTDDSNRGLGFGVFYTMVNVGGFLGPLVAGYVRAISWDTVFLMSSLWILLNFIPALFLYKDADQTDAASDQRGLRQVLLETQEVLGNGRLALLVVPAIIGIMIAAKGGMTYTHYLLVMAIWLGINLVWSSINKGGRQQHWYQQNIRVGNLQFVIYLLIMTGFWTIYNQLFLTLPLYIRDFVDTGDLVSMIAHISPSALDFLAAVNAEQLAAVLPAMAAKLGPYADTQLLTQLRLELVNYKVMPPPDVMQTGLHALQTGGTSAHQLATQWAQSYRQVNPEYIVNLDFGAVVLLQIAISTYLQRFKALPILVFGTLVLSAGLWMAGFSHAVLLGGVSVTMAVFVFAVGEMIASPKSQEYVAAIAPKRKTAMFMGYYFVSMALGNLFAGLLSGWAYTVLARQMQQPMLMWSLFGGIGIVTSIALLAFNLRIRSSQTYAVTV
ncbi:MFS transporter [Undibacterium sp. TS12]|uniref:MFS transporter n=1 Tax=Undibacterium sp. TS12 TaxID=2908202 RepID=UPI001F4D26D9|nr:MFS transporter [Undibacterium sp. TS12]MCH8617986.1 MFS transporter [Undibacterium sp. TS12]